MFQPNQSLSIQGNPYKVAAHPAMPFMVYGQEGRMATVYKLLLDRGAGNRFARQEAKALKVFKKSYQTSSIERKAEELRPFANMPGLQACERFIISPQNPSCRPLLEKFPDLAYAALMPWIEGETWTDVLTARRALTKQQSWRLAWSFLSVLYHLEQHQMAHCDLGSANVIFTQNDGITKVALVDLEQIYAAQLSAPATFLVGSPGYAPQFGGQELWSALGDRFAGGVLLAEMLAWHDPNVREAAYGESYFSKDEIQTVSAKYELLLDVLEQWSSRLKILFQQVWEAPALDACPSFADWIVAFEEVSRDETKVVPITSMDSMEPPAITLAEGIKRESEKAFFVDQSSQERVKDEGDEEKNIEENEEGKVSSLEKKVTGTASLSVEVRNVHEGWQQARQLRQQAKSREALVWYQQVIDRAILEDFPQLYDLLHEYNQYVFEQINDLQRKFYEEHWEHSTMQTVSWGRKVGYWLGGLSEGQLVGIAIVAAIVSFVGLAWLTPIVMETPSLGYVSLSGFLLAVLLRAVKRPPVVTGIFTLVVVAGMLGASTSIGTIQNFGGVVVFALIGSAMLAWGIEALHLDARRPDWYWHLAVITIGSALLGMMVDDFATGYWMKLALLGAYVLNIGFAALGWVVGGFVDDMIVAFRESSGR